MIENQFFDDKKGALFTGLRNTLAVVEGQKRGSLTVEFIPVSGGQNELGIV
jgi:hypothetical protein